MLLSLLALCVHAKVETYPTKPIGACAPHCGDVESEGCKQCCQNYDHETSWQCGTENAADCCTEWGPHCFWERGPHNFGHGCKDCDGPPACCPNGGMVMTVNWNSDAPISENLSKRIEGLYVTKDDAWNKGEFHALMAWGVCAGNFFLNTYQTDDLYKCSLKAASVDSAGMYFAYNVETKECRTFSASCTFETTPTPGFKLYMWAQMGRQFWRRGQSYQILLGAQQITDHDETSHWFVFSRAKYRGGDKKAAVPYIYAPSLIDAGESQHAYCPTDVAAGTWKWNNDKVADISFECTWGLPPANSWSIEGCAEKGKKGSGVISWQGKHNDEGWCGHKCDVDDPADCEVWEYNIRTNICIFYVSGDGKTAAVLDGRQRKYIAGDVSTCYPEVGR